MKNGDLKDNVARRGAKLWKVLVVGGMALAAACASMQKDKGGTGSSDPGTAQSGSSNGHGGGASGW